MNQYHSTLTTSQSTNHHNTNYHPTGHLITMDSIDNRNLDLFLRNMNSTDFIGQNLTTILLSEFFRSSYHNGSLSSSSSASSTQFQFPGNLFIQSSSNDTDFSNNEVYTSSGGSGGILFEFLINGIGTTVVAFLGIIGNIISGIVLSRPQMKSSVTCLLLGLAFCDTLLISIAILIFGLPSISHFTNTLTLYTHVYYPLWVPYLFPISITAQTGSVYLTLAVTVERYVAVCHPLKARSLCTWRRAVISVFAVLTLASLYNLPRWFEVLTVEAGYLEEYNNITIYANAMSELRDSSIYKDVYINWMYLIVMYLVPFTGLVVFNWAIYRQVRKANRERQVMSKLQRRELGLATMLLFVVGVFLLCNVLPLVNNVLECFYDKSIDQLVQFSNFLVVFNSSVNFVIYCTCGERFRRLLLRLCHDCLLCRLMGGNKRKSSLFRKSNFRGRHAGDFEEVSMASVANNHTCVTMATTNYTRSTSIPTSGSNDGLFSKNKNGKVHKNGSHHTNNNLIRHNNTIPTATQHQQPNNKFMNGELGGGAAATVLKNSKNSNLHQVNNKNNNGVIIGNAINSTTANNVGAHPPNGINRTISYPVNGTPSP